MLNYNQFCWQPDFDSYIKMNRGSLSDNWCFTRKCLESWNKIAYTPYGAHPFKCCGAQKLFLVDDSLVGVEVATRIRELRSQFGEVNDEEGWVMVTDEMNPFLIPNIRCDSENKFYGTEELEIFQDRPQDPSIVAGILLKEKNIHLYIWVKE